MTVTSRRNFLGLAAATAIAGPTAAKALVESASALPVALPAVPLPPICPTPIFIEAQANYSLWKNEILREYLRDHLFTPYMEKLR